MDSQYLYKPYPRRLYLNGEVIEGDLHATNSVVVESAQEETDARSKGYRKAYEPIGEESIGGNGGSPSALLPAPTSESLVSQTQDSAAAVSAGPDDELTALRVKAEGLGIVVDGRWRAPRLQAEIERVAA